MTLRTTLARFTAVAALLSTGSAMAHSDEFLNTQATPNGGQLRMAGNYHFELVVVKDSKDAKSNPVRVYVTDHGGAKIATGQAKGSVTLLAGKAKTTVALTPDGDNVLKGVGSYASTPDLKAVVAVTFPGQPTEQARFTPLAKPKDEHGGHMH